jgi:hypothetical protein
VSAPTSELGYANQAGFGWWAAPQDEETPELRWPDSVRVYDRMRRQDSQVKSVLRAVTLPVRRTAWRIDPAGARPEVVALVAEDLGLPVLGQDDIAKPRRTRDRFSWSRHLQLSLLSLAYGHMFFEQVYRLDGGGRARLRKLAPRMPRTIAAINVATDGGLISIEQHPAVGQSTAGVLGVLAAPKIPVARLVAYVNEQEGGDWVGTSLLRPAYKNWLIKDRLLRVQAQTIARNGMGVPLYEDGPLNRHLDEGLKMAQGWRSGDAAAAAVPHGAKLTLRGVEGALPDADPAIRYHDEQIARSSLLHFLNLGTQTGSWALGTTFADFFILGLQTLAEEHRDVAQQHIVEDLVDVNFGEDEPAPQLVFEEIGSRQAATAQAIKLLIEAGALSGDQALERHLRQQYGLPAADPATARSAPGGQPPPEPPADDDEGAPA